MQTRPDQATLDKDLLSAAASGNLKLVTALLERGASVIAAGVDGRTALELAARNGHSEVVDLLFDKLSTTLETKAALLNFFIKNKKLSDPAIWTMNAKITVRLVNLCNDMANGGNLSKIMPLLPDVNAAHQFQNKSIKEDVLTYLETLAKEERITAYREALNPDTPMGRFMRLSRGAVRCRLGHGALLKCENALKELEPKAQTSEDITALKAKLKSAAYYGKIDEIESILKLEAFGIDEALDEKGNSALNIAAASGYAGAVKLLIDKGADIHHFGNYTRRKPLMDAVCCHYHTEVQATIEALLAAGAKVLDADGNQSVLEMAAQHASPEVLNLIVNKLISSYTIDQLTTHLSTYLRSILHIETRYDIKYKAIEIFRLLDHLRENGVSDSDIVRMMTRSNELVDTFGTNAFYIKRHYVNHIATLPVNEQIKLCDDILNETTPRGYFMRLQRGDNKCDLDSGSLKKVVAMRVAALKRKDAANKFTNGEPAILIAAGQSSHAVAQLIHDGADVNLTTSSGVSALIKAIDYNNLATVKLLLESGADPSLTARVSKKMLLSKIEGAPANTMSAEAKNTARAYLASFDTDTAEISALQLATFRDKENTGIVALLEQYLPKPAAPVTVKIHATAPAVATAETQPENVKVAAPVSTTESAPGVVTPAAKTSSEEIPALATPKKKSSFFMTPSTLYADAIKIATTPVSEFMQPTTTANPIATPGVVPAPVLIPTPVAAPFADGCLISFTAPVAVNELQKEKEARIAATINALSDLSFFAPAEATNTTETERDDEEVAAATREAEISAQIDAMPSVPTGDKKKLKTQYKQMVLG